MRPYRGRHERPTPPPSLDRAGNRARTAELVGTLPTRGRHEEAPNG